MKLSVIRGIIKSVTARAGRLARFSAEGRGGESFDDREAIQQYGLASCPPKGAECLILHIGDCGGPIYMINSDDRRYRILLKDGEAALYDDSGSVVHLQAGGKILIESTGEVTVKSDKVTVEANDAAVKANSVKVDSGDVTLGAGLVHGGVLTESLTPAICPYLTTTGGGTPVPHPPIGIASSTVKAAP